MVVCLFVASKNCGMLVIVTVYSTELFFQLDLKLYVTGFRCLDTSIGSIVPPAFFDQHRSSARLGRGASALGDLRAYDPRLRSAGLDATWGFRRNSGQGGSQGRCPGSTGRTCDGSPTGNLRQRRTNCRHGAREPSPPVVQRDR
jgi:hypothetical protein